MPGQEASLVPLLGALSVPDIVTAMQHWRRCADGPEAEPEHLQNLALLQRIPLAV